MKIKDIRLRERSKTRVYISGKMSGVDNYAKYFDQAEEFLRKQGFTPVNPAKLDLFFNSTNLTYEEMMSIDLMVLHQCEAIFMLENYTDSPGANREFGYAFAEKKIILYAKDYEI